jgi:hypothetical protein
MKSVFSVHAQNILFASLTKNNTKVCFKNRIIISVPAFPFRHWTFFRNILPKCTYHMWLSEQFLSLMLLPKSRNNYNLKRISGRIFKVCK